MGSLAQSQIDAWLAGGSIAITASDRAARALAAAFHRARQSQGLTAWSAPKIQDWKSFAREAWSERNLDGRLLLNPWQEESLWEQIAGSEPHPATVLPAPRRRIAALAMEAHDLLASHAPRYLKPQARTDWQQDAAAFSGWLRSFSETCRTSELLSASHVPLELISQLEQDGGNNRPPLLVAGFDRILPVQRKLFDAWGAWREASRNEAPPDASYVSAADERSELEACAQWCRHKLAANPRARLLVVAQDTDKRRGDMERTFLDRLGANGTSQFEFSLGIPLGKIALAKSANLMLRWLSRSLEEAEVDWLLSTGYAAANEQENAQLQRYLRKLRQRGDQRITWTLSAFCSQRTAHRDLPPDWAQRMKTAQQRLQDIADRKQSPLDWAALAPELLKAAGWLGSHSLTSSEFQIARRFQQSVDTCASLGFDGRGIRWQEFLSTLARMLDETLFAPESRDAPIQIVGPAESAGLAADAVWFLGADEDTWPASGSTHPFLPLHVQREGEMPHATAQLDWQLAHAITERILATAPEVHFSHARQKGGVEARHSRLVSQLAGEPRPLPEEPSVASSPATVFFEDVSRVPFRKTTILGGAAVLTAQSQCPFKAFAIVRLGARGWEPAVAGLTPAQRGQLIHAVLHAVWGGRPGGIRTLAELRALPDSTAFVSSHVERVVREQIPAAVRERMPRRYLDLEQARLARLVAQWLEYESSRHAFSVIETEAESGAVVVAGLALQLRLDRIDRLNDGSLLVIDYKTGDVSPSSWDLPRPEDVQLPLYACFALDAAEQAGGLAFAKVRTGDNKIEFAGRIKDARSTLIGSLGGTSSLVKKKLEHSHLDEWRACIEQLARDFIAGRAEADPRDYPKTCERCELPVLCRIHESREQVSPDGADEDEGASDE